MGGEDWILGLASMMTWDVYPPPEVDVTWCQASTSFHMADLRVTERIDVAF